MNNIMDLNKDNKQSRNHQSHKKTLKDSIASKPTKSRVLVTYPPQQNSLDNPRDAQA